MEKKKRIFISYDSQNDRRFKNLLLAWNDKKEYAYELSEVIDVPVINITAEEIKKRISNEIKDGNIFLVIVGKNTHENAWVNWEIEKAKELGGEIIVVKTDKDNPIPIALKDNAWITFDHDSIIKALQNVKE